MAINSLHPTDNSLSMGPGMAKTFRFSCKAMAEVTKLPLFLRASTTKHACDNPAMILFRSIKSALILF